jgi:tight adherence protein C
MDMTFNLAELIPWAVFGGFFCAVWAMLSHFSSKPSRADNRLDAMRDPVRTPESDLDCGETGLGIMIDKAVPTLSKPLRPTSRLEQQRIKLRLAHAGFNAPIAVEVYLSLRLAALICGGIIGSGTGLAAFGLNRQSVVAAVIGAGIGFYLPELILSWVIKSRQHRIFLSLPDALDLLIIAIEVGQGFDAALRRVAKELAGTAADLCAEFNLYSLQLQMGRSRREALHDLGIRAGVDDLNSVAAVLMQADRFGTSVAQTLRELSDSLRVKRRQIAEERAQQTAVKLIFPLVLFIFPGIFVILVGPAAISMINDMLHM